MKKQEAPFVCSNERFSSFMENEGGYLMVHKFIRENYAFLDPADVESDLYLCIAHALAQYDENRVDVKPFTFVFGACQNTIKMLYRAKGAQMRTWTAGEVFSFDDELSEAEAEGLDELATVQTKRENAAMHSLKSTVEDEDAPQSAVERAFLRNALHSALRTAGLTSQERVVVQRTMEGMSQTNMAREVGCSQSQISKTLTEAKSKLKIELAKKGVKGVA